MSNIIRRIKDWARFQHWKSGPYADAPPWIKLYPRLLNDLKWFKLPDRDKAVLVELWMLASERGGTLPDLESICFRLRRSEKDIKSVLDRLPHWIESEVYKDYTNFVHDEYSYGYTLEEEKEKEKETEKETEHTRPSDEVTEQAFNAYNQTAKKLGLPLANKLDKSRKKKLRAILVENGLLGWKEALAGIENQPFLLGEGPRGWRADFDFLVQPKSFRRVSEQSYRGGAGPPPKLTRNEAALAKIRERHDGNGRQAICDQRGGNAGGELPTASPRPGNLHGANDSGLSREAEDAAFDDG